MAKLILIAGGIFLIVAGILAYYSRLTIEPSWLRIVLIVLGGLTFIIGLTRRK